MGGLGGIDLEDSYKFMKEMMVSEGINIQVVDANLPIIKSQHSNIAVRYQSVTGQL